MRAAFDKRTLILRDESVRERTLAIIRNLPVDAEKPLQVVISDYKPPRKKSQNDLMWSGPLKDISEQAWFEGKQFSADVLHHYFKVQLLPEEFDPELCREGYRKWEYDPSGDRVLVGSTTMLTVKGMAQHIEAIHAFGASLGVQFSANPNERY